MVVVAVGVGVESLRDNSSGALLAAVRAYPKPG